MLGRIEDYQHYLPMNVRVLYNVRSVIRETFWRQVYRVLIEDAEMWPCI